MKNYLPSKKFIYTFSSFLTVGIIIFLIFNVFFSKNSFVSYLNKKKEGKIDVDKLSALKLVQHDTDGDGVPDWKETLWGTDPNNQTTFDQVSDLKYIADKSKGLNITGNDSEDLSETDKFAREFFATYMAMKTSGQDMNSINNFSSALGQKIANPNIVDQYVESDLTLQNKDKKAYYSEVRKLFDNYRSSGMGDELGIVNNGLAASSKMSGSEFVEKLIAISLSYKNFAEGLAKIPVPEELAKYALAVINNSNNTGISVEEMSKISSDPIIGLTGLTQYQKYNPAFVESAEELETKALE